MLIECPSCGARADLNRARADVHVRCNQCGTVYAAARARIGGPGSARRLRSGERMSGLVYAVIAIVAVLVIILVVVSSEDPEPPAPKAKPAETGAAEVEVDEGLGWESFPVQALVALYDAVADEDRARIAARLYGPGLLAAERDGARADGPDVKAHSILLPEDRRALIDRGVDELLADENVAGWKPYDCELVSRSEDTARVRLAVTPLDPERIEKRWVLWDVARDGERWKAWRWERWISAAEERTARLRDRNKRVYLSDGSSVFERPPEPLPHLDDTPAVLRNEIDELFATMTDLDLTTEASAAQHRLVDIGRPAIPILLTGLYETPLDSEENAIKCNLMVQTLRRITGQHFGFEPQVAEASSVGTTDERRQSSIRQWFAWWYTNKDTFTEKVVEDGLEAALGGGDANEPRD